MRNIILALLFLPLGLFSQAPMIPRGPMYQKEIITPTVVANAIAIWNWENSGADDSGNGNTTSLYQASYSAKALAGSFGVACITTSSDIIFTSDINHTSAFFYNIGMAREGEHPTEQRILSNTFVDDDGFEWMVDVRNHYARINIQNGSVYTVDSDAVMTVPEDESYHVYGLYINQNTMEVRFYCDGVNIGTKTLPSTFSTTQNSRIGQNGWSWYDCGQIYEFISGDPDALAVILFNAPSIEY